MENASKALLIAGGVLFTMLIVGVIVFARDRFSEYYSSQSVIKGIENTAEFNKQFTNYEKENVTGNELISLINKVIDYNDRESSAVTNNSQASPITININFVSSAYRKNFLYNATGTNYLFTSNTYSQAGSAYSGDTNYSFKNDIIKKVQASVDEVGSERDIEKIAKDIWAIFENGNASLQEQSKGITSDQKREAAIKQYNAYISSDETKQVSTWNQLLTQKKDAVYRYYEYVQFKKGIFKCTGITYNQSTDNASTGRVETLNFEFTNKFQ